MHENTTKGANRVWLHQKFFSKNEMEFPLWQSVEKHTPHIHDEVQKRLKNKTRTIIDRLLNKIKLERINKKLNSFRN
jgi:hypothetical protein